MAELLGFDRAHSISTRLKFPSKNSNCFFGERKFCFRRRKCKTNSFAQKISCSSNLLDQCLKPRIRQPTQLLEKETEVPVPNENLVSGICNQIEKLVFLHGKHLAALELFEILESKKQNTVPYSTFDALVTACIGLKSVKEVKRVFRYMVSSGFEPDLYLRNRVLLMHVKCAMMIDAYELFEEMQERNLVTWNTIIGGLVDSGNLFEAFRLFFIMWNEESAANSRTLTTMIRASSGLEFISPGKQLHSLALKLNIGNDIYVSCSLIDMYSKCGSLEDARCVFDGMVQKTTVAWNNIIAGYNLHGYSEEALRMYYEMQEAGVKMDQFTFSLIVRVCTRLASLEHAKQAHAGLVRHGFGTDIFASTALVDFYSKWGRVEDARIVFEKMPLRNVICWNALIAGYGNHGRGVEAVELFKRMISEGMAPNHVTFLAVLSACSYSGLSDNGWELFESMTRDYTVKPRAMHYACMIELLGREGLLDEALALIRDAPFEPTANMWAALLTACRVHKNFVLGKFAAEKLYRMEPEKLNNYIVLLNIYNSSGKLEEAASVIHTLKRKGLRMYPACTWIDVKKQSYVFFSGDKVHAQSSQIYERLDKLMKEISKRGYVQEGKCLLPDVDDREQEMRLYHSEKLAVSFGLLNTVDFTPLHLVQSHRVCGDCHNAIKGITLITKREIILRDGSRFHHFKNGMCSCGDYW